MKFSHVTISVRNLDESLEFYKSVIGLPVNRRFSAGDSEIAFLGNGETEIELICNKSHSDVLIGQDISLGFTVASLQEISSRLIQMGIEPGEVLQPNPQVMFFFIADPNGVRVQFVEHL